MRQLFKSTLRCISDLRESHGQAGARRPVRRLPIEPLEDRRLLASLLIKHTPRLQLGDAPLAQYTGIATDQVQILWQTMPAAARVPPIRFSSTIALPGHLTGRAVAAIDTIDTGVEERINHYVDITGLRFDSDYEYRVQHLRDNVVVANYQETFHTRLPTGDASEFTFVAYGDSADNTAIANFRMVQDRINQIDAAFAVTLGDNAYRMVLTATSMLVLIRILIPRLRFGPPATSTI